MNGSKFTACSLFLTCDELASITADGLPLVNTAADVHEETVA